jgi:cation diffusion facilitator CzcD-associated flavoprotein CzcO
VIVGAGLSGIGSACHLRRSCPGRTFVLLETRATLGGTWDLFRYPGVRSDSDMYTLGYRFKPWRGARAIADGPAILAYLDETARENDITRHVRFGHRAVSAAWSSAEARWTVEVERADGGDPVRFGCAMLLLCGGYYRYDRGHPVTFAGAEDFRGTIAHPQFWPRDLDYAGKRVAVIGSGATAMTLVPALARTAAHVTMVQRSPTYVVSLPDVDPIAAKLKRFLPERLAYALTRWKNIRFDVAFYRKTRTHPEAVKAELIGLVRQKLGPDYDVATHFTPRYGPWDQRLCLIPNDDLFDAIKAGTASVVTDRVERFTPTGLKLASGADVPADIIVTATGLEIQVLNGMTLAVDGRPVSLPDTFSYKGMMYSDVPNLVQTFGYINASWTLRADLTAEFVCRLLNRMAARGLRQATPRIGPADRDMEARPWIEGFSAGYVQRALPFMPKQGDRGPWRHTQDYAKDKAMIRGAPIEDGVLELSNPLPGRERGKAA